MFFYEHAVFIVSMPVQILVGFSGVVKLFSVLQSLYYSKHIYVSISARLKH